MLLQGNRILYISESKKDCEEQQRSYFALLKENKFQKSSFRGNLKKDLEYFSGCRQCLGWKDGIKESLRFLKRKAKRGK